MPNNMNSGRKYTNAGMVCIASSTGRMASSTRGRSAAHIPSGSPITTASRTAADISASERMVSSHSPIRPVYNSAPAATAPAFHIRTRAGMRKATATTTNQGSHSRRFPMPDITALTKLLIGVKKDVNTGCESRLERSHAPPSSIGDSRTVSHRAGNTSPHPNASWRTIAPATSTRNGAQLLAGRRVLTMVPGRRRGHRSLLSNSDTTARSMLPIGFRSASTTVSG